MICHVSCWKGPHIVSGVRNMVPRGRSYDVDDQDSFWTAHAGDQFPEVLNAASWLSPKFRWQVKWCPVEVFGGRFLSVFDV